MNLKTAVLIVLLATVARYSDASKLNASDTKTVAKEAKDVISDRSIVLNNEIDENPDTCAQLNQVQSVVIQLLASHYEYNKGMEILTGESNTIQHDIVNLKSRLEEMDSSQSTMDERVKQLTMCQNNLTALLSTSNTTQTQPQARQETRSDVRRLRHNSVLSDNPQHIAANELIQRVSNLSKTIQLQNKVLNDHERQMRRLRRSISRVEEKLETLVSVRLNDTMEKDIARHFMEKQKEINGNMLASIRYLEEHFKEMTQSDAPSHNGGCPNGFVRHIMSCYRFVNSTAYWVDAENTCQGFHPRAHLLALETAEEEAFVVHFRNYNNARWTSMYIWTGATDMTQESQWSWVGTSKPLTYTNWRPGQPDLHNNNWQHCIYLRTDGDDHRWDDWHCNAAKLNFVCEINVQA